MAKRAKAKGLMKHLSPINQRRMQNFRANGRGYWSFWIFLVLFVISLGAELVANDKPILMKYEDSYLMPIFATYPETRFGGTFVTEADYHDPYVQDLVKQSGGWMIWPLIPYSYDTLVRGKTNTAPLPPNGANWLGTDDHQRDVLARVIYGFRTSVIFALVLTIFSSMIGVTAGAVQGYFGGWVDLSFQRFIEIWTGIPALYVLIILAAVFEPNFWILLGAMLLFKWVVLVGVVRAEFLRGRNFEYVKAARALGVRNRVIIMRHILPNAMVATLTFLPFLLSASITTLSSLDFLGFGLPPGSASLGELARQGKNHIYAPWLGVTAFVVLATMLSLLVFTGEAVRDAFDPRKSGLTGGK